MGHGAAMRIKWRIPFIGDLGRNIKTKTKKYLNTDSVSFIADIFNFKILRRFNISFVY